MQTRSLQRLLHLRTKLCVRTTLYGGVIIGVESVSDGELRGGIVLPERELRPGNGGEKNESVSVGGLGEIGGRGLAFDDDLKVGVERALEEALVLLVVAPRPEVLDLRFRAERNSNSLLLLNLRNHSAGEEGGIYGKHPSQRLERVDVGVLLSLCVDEDGHFGRDEHLIGNQALHVLSQHVVCRLQRRRCSD